MSTKRSTFPFIHLFGQTITHFCGFSFAKTFRTYTLNMILLLHACTCSRPIDIAIPSLMSVTIRHCIAEIILPQDHSIVQFSELFDITKFARGHPPP